MKDFEAYKVGVFCASICSNLAVEETARRLNEERPTGIDSRWALSGDATFKSGEPNPCPCDRSPQTHKHYLFDC